MKRLELMAPAGDMKSFKAALYAGADAIYLGLSGFNARRRAENIRKEDLFNLVRIAHARGTKVFLTANTLVTENEIEEYINLMNHAVRCRIDAVIVEDIGMLALLRKVFPYLEVHASTQCTTHNSAQVRFLSGFGVTQVNLARELSLKEMTRLATFTHSLGIRAEVFVHGAYCVSFSGICYMSSFIGGESGNRGICMQPCRKSYGTEKNGPKSYFLSLKDLNTFSHLKELVVAGIDTLKIEGRIKHYSYVYNTVKAWKENMELFRQGKETRKDDKRLYEVFHRGFSDGYFKENISRAMLAESPIDKSLIRRGTVRSYCADSNILYATTDNPLTIGEEIALYEGRNFFICSSVIEEKVQADGYRIRIEGKLYGKIVKNQLLFSRSRIMEKEAIDSAIGSMKAQPLLLDLSLSGKEGSPLAVSFTCEGKTVLVRSNTLLQKAQKSPLNEAMARDQMGRLGTSPYTLGTIDLSGLTPGLFIPVSELNSIRRKGILLLDEPQTLFYHDHIPSHCKTPLTHSLAIIVSDPDEASTWYNAVGRVFIEVNHPHQLYADMSPAIPLLPAIVFDSHFPEWEKALAASPCETVMCRNSGLVMIARDKGKKWIAGEEFNLANSPGLDAIAAMDHVNGAFISKELSKKQASAIVPPQNLPLYYTVFGPLLLFTTRQCLLAAPLSCTKQRTDDNCRITCTRHATLFDEKEIPFHVVKRTGVYTEVYNDALLCVPQAVTELEHIISCFVLDFRDLPFFTAARQEKMALYQWFRGLLRGKKQVPQPDILNRYAFTRGNYHRGLR